MNRLVFTILAVISLIVSGGCLFPEEEKPKEKYVLKAIIVAIPEIARPNEIITFDATQSKGELVEYWWDFNVSEELEWQKGSAIMTYRYSEPGIYTIALKVIDKNGNESKTTIFVYINWEEEIYGSVSKRAKNDTLLPIRDVPRRVVVTLEYEPTIIYSVQTENLDLSIKVKYDNNYTYIKSSNETNDKGKVVLELTKIDIFYNLGKDWYAEVYYNSTAPSARPELEYTLGIEIYYNP